MDATTALATSGPLLLAALVAVAAGAVSFASPCVVPLVPGYLAYLAGLVGVEAPLESGRHRWRVAGAAALFVAGFTVVFGAILVGVVWLADALVDNQAVLQRVGGVVMIAMGLAFVGLIPVLQHERRLHWLPRRGCGAPRSSARCSGWAGCRASGRRWPGWSPSRRARAGVAARRRAHAGLLRGPRGAVRPHRDLRYPGGARGWAGCAATPGPSRSAAARC